MIDSRRPYTIFYQLVFFWTVLFFILTSELFAEPVRQPHITVEAVSDVTSAKPGAPIKIGFYAKLDPGWHIYWKHPGDSGRAPELRWKTQPEVMLSESFWPTPRRIEVGPLVNYGYDGEALVFFETTMPNDGLSAILNAEWLVCEENCIPGKAQLPLNISTSVSRVPSAFSTIFHHAELSLPRKLGAFQISQTRKNNTVIISMRSEGGAPLPKSSLSFFSDSKRQIEHSAPQDFSHSGDAVFLSVQLAGSAPAELQELSGILVSPDGFDGGVPAIIVGEQKEPARPTQTLVSESPPFFSLSVLSAIWFAFLGGVLLNIMPCVFPVLSLKVLNMVHGDAKAHRRYGNWYALGVILSFTALGGLFLVFRSYGATLGWGFQLQYPPFVFFIATLLFLVGLNLTGVYEVGATLQSQAGRVSCDGSSRGSFLSGILATLIATPCTAPFMGAALAAAVSLSAVSGFMVFFFLGVGLAAPLWGISYIPSLSRYLPKPGAWMDIFKRGMSFPIFGTALWLLYVYSLQTSLSSLIAVLTGFIIIAAGAWIFGLGSSPQLSNGKRRFWRLIGISLVAWGIFHGIPHQATGSMNHEEGVFVDNHGQRWLPYSKQIVNDLLSQGKPMYLDFTALWCVTCQVNKSVVFASDEVRAVIKEKKITLIRGDWTSQDQAITEALGFYGAEGVPLNVVYPGRARAEPIVLPSLLTPSIVLEAFAQ